MDCSKLQKKLADNRLEFVPWPLLRPMRVGALGKGLMLRGDCRTRVVVQCRGKPTATFLHAFTNLLMPLLSEQFKCCIYENEASFYILSTSRLVTLNVLVKVTLTSSPFYTQHGFEEAIVRDFLSDSHCRRAYFSLQHVSFVRANAARVPACLKVMRLLRYLRRSNAAWQLMKNWQIEVVCIHVTAEVGWNCTVAQMLTRVLQTVRDKCGTVMDPCRRNIVIWQYLKDEEYEQVKTCATEWLNMITSNRAYDVFSVSKSLLRPE